MWKGLWGSDGGAQGVWARHGVGTAPTPRNIHSGEGMGTLSMEKRGKYVRGIGPGAESAAGGGVVWQSVAWWVCAALGRSRALL